MSIMNGLQEKHMQQFELATTWFYKSRAATIVSQSVAYIALISAIEALLPKSDEQKCPTCHQAIHGLTQKFTGFLSKYAPHSPEFAVATEQLAKVYYATRSKVTHGANLFRWDISPWEFTSHRGSREDELFSLLRQSVRIALINWLLDDNKA